jgi:hypothetical protein
MPIIRPQINSGDKHPNLLSLYVNKVIREIGVFLGASMASICLVFVSYKINCINLSQ